MSLQCYILSFLKYAERATSVLRTSRHLRVVALRPEASPAELYTRDYEDSGMPLVNLRNVVRLEHTGFDTGSSTRMRVRLLAALQSAGLKEIYWDQINPDPQLLAPILEGNRDTLHTLAFDTLPDTLLSKLRDEMPALTFVHVRVSDDRVGVLRTLLAPRPVGFPTLRFGVILQLNIKNIAQLEPALWQELTRRTDSIAVALMIGDIPRHLQAFVQHNVATLQIGRGSWSYVQAAHLEALLLQRGAGELVPPQLTPLARSLRELHITLEHHGDPITATARLISQLDIRRLALTVRDYRPFFHSDDEGDTCVLPRGLTYLALEGVSWRLEGMHEALAAIIGKRLHPPTLESIVISTRRDISEELKGACAAEGVALRAVARLPCPYPWL